MGELNNLSLTELEEKFVVIRNIECDYVLGLMDNKSAQEVFGEVKDCFPLSADSLVDEEIWECIKDNKVVSKDKVRRNFYENMDLGVD
jgi:hypothetical protein